MKNYCIRLLLFVICIIELNPAQCITDSIWENLPVTKQINDLNSRLKTIDESCLSAYIASIKALTLEDSDSLTIFIKRWNATNNIGYKTLFAAYSNGLTHRNHQLWQTIFKLWNKTDNTPQIVLSNLINTGDPVAADSLYKILDSEGGLSFHDFLRWTRVKVVLNDLSALPNLYCRIISTKPQIAQGKVSGDNTYTILSSQLMGQIVDINGEKASKILQEFRTCALDRVDSDTTLILSWIAQAYCKIEMVDKAIETLSSIKSKSSMVTRQLFDIAQQQFLSGEYLMALNAAKATYESTKNGDLRSDAATYIYKSFSAMDMNDSAASWIKKVNLSSEDQIVEAIILYQNTGHYTQADKLIQNINPSLQKDSLAIRQFIFTNNFEKANSLIQTSPYFNQPSSDRYLWESRVLLFSRRISELASKFDSLPIPVTSGEASDLLMYKYWLEQLKECPDAVEAWASIEYYIYIGMLEKSIPLSENKNIVINCRWRLALRVAQALYSKRMFSKALTTLSSFEEDSVSAEFLYYKAICLYETGAKPEAKKLLEHILLDFSSEIFSEKARLFLSNF